MLQSDEAARLARILTTRLDTNTLAQVIAQLLGHEGEPAFRPKPAYRKKDFKEALGNVSESMWQDLRGRKKIPRGKQISPNIEIWTHEQILATIADLAAEQEQRNAQSAARDE